jgi:Ca2+-binding RTX toxin-like protein
MPNQAPTVTPLFSFVDQNGWARFTSMFTATDSDGFITQYEFFDNTTVAGSSYFWVNGATPVSSLANSIIVSVADLENVWLHGGTSIGGVDALLVRAYDNSGAVSTYQPISLTTQASSGANVILGTSADETLPGTPGADQIFGNTGNDTLNGNVGNDSLDGGTGLDTARFNGPMSSYTITHTGTSGTVTGPDGTDTFSSIERLQFDDTSLGLVARKSDFNGDLTSDLVWRNNDGTVAIWPCRMRHISRRP